MINKTSHHLVQSPVRPWGYTLKGSIRRLILCMWCSEHGGRSVMLLGYWLLPESACEVSIRNTRNWNICSNRRPTYFPRKAAFVLTLIYCWQECVADRAGWDCHSEQQSVTIGRDQRHFATKVSELNEAICNFIAARGSFSFIHSPPWAVYRGTVFVSRGPLVETVLPFCFWMLYCRRCFKIFHHIFYVRIGVKAWKNYTIYLYRN
jgi:hypothetical protein